MLHSVYTVVDGRPVDPSPLSWFHYHRLSTSALWFLGENANFLSGEYDAGLLLGRGVGAGQQARPRFTEFVRAVLATGTETRGWEQ